MRDGRFGEDFGGRRHDALATDADDEDVYVMEMSSSV